MIKLVNSYAAKSTIQKIKFNQYRSFYIGRVSVSRDAEGQVVHYLGDGCDTRYFMIWKDDVGFILTREMKKKDPELYIMSNNRFKAMLKRIDDSELASFTENGYNHVKIGDMNYTIIRIVKPGSRFSERDTINDYFEEGDIDVIVKKDDDEEVDKFAKSTELF